ncbi:sugar ABC transporter ATP-binding protein [Herbiconiux ginsengi]|uniref:Monosaccharide ABC transporter ATP-binding protein, CUT2 family n=1 Tax=Herbiconiux ginsengi TaxID=381665 RepID=A0A1H3TZH0_9MICO|nr:sugar ABC transporter ATP-binding protein [Herbiconiux ginsengi]SDZ55610.1 monosaccharide ABC transporter ATP-binding protein, CUT2 family [Herbiconiux ginsengi]
MTNDTLTPALHLTGIEKSYGATRALRDGNLTVHPGEIHAIVGENGAGKSTLMNIVSGATAPDAGTILVNGEQVTFSGPRDAARSGIAIVHQELALCPDVSVAENVFLDAIPTRAGFVRFGDINRRTRELLAPFRAQISPRARTGDLPLADQQVVEIAHALAHDCRVVIFDEPTSSLTEPETLVLHALIRDLSRRGIASIYISHRLSEVFELADRVTVMRDGAWVTTIAVTQTTPDALVERMVGRSVEHLYPPKATEPGVPILAVEDLTGARFDSVSFVAHAGEILGVSGLIGSGRTELMRGVAGIDRRSGRVSLGGKPLNGSFRSAIRAGLSYMSEDRKDDGLFLNLSVQNNVIVTILHQVSRLGMITGSIARKRATVAAHELGTKMADLEQPISALSGGNQQKAMIAKWLVAGPKVLILDEPTRGIDVGAKFEIHKHLRHLADNGMALILISSELDEVVGLSDRVLVMREGRLAGTLTGAIDEADVITLAAGASGTPRTTDSKE